MSTIGLELTDSVTLGELAVAAAAVLLALLICWLGFQTRASAKAAQEAVTASEEPFVLATPTDSIDAMTLRAHETRFLGGRGVSPPFEIHRSHNDDGSHFVRLKLWNIGSGPAIVRQVRLHRHRDEFVDGLPHVQPIGAGGAVDTEIGSSAWPESSNVATLTIDYTRASGRVYRTTSEVLIDGPLVLCRTYERSRAD